MTGPRIVTEGPPSDRWQREHVPVYRAWAMRRVAELMNNTEKQYTPEFLRAYEFVAEQEDAQRKMLQYTEATDEYLHRAIGLSDNDPTRHRYIRQAASRLNGDGRRVDKMKAFQLWRESNAQHMPNSLGLVHYDAFVNHGPGRARRMLVESQGDANRYINIRDQFYTTIPENASEGGPVANPGWRTRRIPALRRTVAQMLAQTRRADE